MAERILIDPVTRIEGHAKISIYVSDHGQVESAQVHVTEFRGFERFVLGRPFHEAPGIMARICGICPISHILASAKAGDMLLGVAVPEAAERQRRLLTYAQVLQSHALSFFHLSSPDLLVGFDAPPEQRNLFAMAATADAEFMRRGIGLRRFGQKVIESIAGKRVHPSWGVPGGVLSEVTAEQRDELLSMVPEAYESLRLALDRMKKLIEQHAREVEGLGSFPTLYLGTVTRDGELEFYDGVLRMVDGEGNIVADHLDPQRYFTFLSEAAEEWSFMKFPYYKPLGYPGGCYRVGPLARLNVARWAGTPQADRELREFRQRGRGAVNHTFHYHLARLIEMLHSVERMEELLADPALLGRPVRARAGQNRNEGVGSCEAPRGVLFHRYEVNDSGLITRADLLIATAQNNQAMNRSVQEAAEHFVMPSRLAEGMLNRVEAAVRCYDPCLSCATHALGQMPFEITLKRRDGTTLDSVRR